MSSVGDGRALSGGLQKIAQVAFARDALLLRPGPGGLRLFERGRHLSLAFEQPGADDVHDVELHPGEDALHVGVPLAGSAVDLGPDPPPQFCATSGATAHVFASLQESYPGIAADYGKSYSFWKSAPCDIFLGSHGAFFNMNAKRAKMGIANNPFVTRSIGSSA